jgi:signal transduction histidine kinase
VRPGRLDLGLGLGGVALGLLALGSVSAAGVVTAVVMGAALGLGRIAPPAAWILGSAAFIAAGLAGVVPGGDSFVPLVLVLVLGVLVGRYDSRVSGIAGIAVLGGASVACAVMAGDAWVPYLLLPASAWGAGRALREREVVAGQLAQRARELEAEREVYAALSVRYERARIASELHDIVAHAISVMVVQASAGQRLVGHDPDATAETFEAIAGAARQAESEMGRLVDLLADERTTTAGPDLALVGELVSRASGSGLDVTLTLEGPREGLSPEVAQLAYRVVQEGLTNALRYAAGAAVSVRVRGEPGGLAVEVENGPAAHETALAGAGTGNGLRGLRERAEVLGGSLEAGPDAAGGWRLAARLPRLVQRSDAAAPARGTTLRGG